MGKKIFISYRYGDTMVSELKERNDKKKATKARDYVTKLQEDILKGDHINKGEKDEEDLSHLKDETIASKIRTKIYDSSVTVVLVSKGMKKVGKKESDQWIPWEVSYSLKEHSRNGVKSQTNAVLAVVIPDDCGEYDYYIKDNVCEKCNCRTLMTTFLFKILKENMFNTKSPKFSDCTEHKPKTIYTGESSYILSVKWDDFIKNPNHYIERSVSINSCIEDYQVTKEL